jgi:hypothetical protein
MYVIYGRRFAEIHQNNQFRTNAMNRVTAALEFLEDFTLFNEQDVVAARIAGNRGRLEAALEGYDSEGIYRIRPYYTKLEAIHDKLRVVHIFEDTIVDTFGMFAARDAQQYSHVAA